MGDSAGKYILEGLCAVSLIGVPAYLLFAEHGFDLLQCVEIMAVQLALTGICGRILAAKIGKK